MAFSQSYTDCLFRDRATQSLVVLSKQRLVVKCLAHCHVLFVFQGSDRISQSFLHPERRIWTSQPRSSYHLPASSLSAAAAPGWYTAMASCSSPVNACEWLLYLSIDVPSDMAITDADHESKVLNHPASWSVQQVLLSDTQHRGTT